MYSENIKVLLDLYKLFFNHELQSTLMLNEPEIMYKLDGLNRIHWTGHFLKIIIDNYPITIGPNLLPQQHESVNFKNVASFLTKRLTIVLNSPNLYTNIGDELISTHSFLDEEVHFQYSTVINIPDLDIIQDMCYVCDEIIKMNLYYSGTYQVPYQFNLKSILRYLKKTYPEKDGHHWSLDD